MSWTDLKSIETIHKLKDIYNVKTLIETGTFKGVTARLHSSYFERVFTVELSAEFATFANKHRLQQCPNVIQVLKSSTSFFKEAWDLFRDIPTILYLDAHFYDPALPIDKRFVILDELEHLKNSPNCIIAIHDFDNKQLGHITYDGVSLDYELLKHKLVAINPDFHWYSNTKKQCDIVKTEDVLNNKYPLIPPDPDILDNLEYVWSKDEKTYRGILYCTPTELDLSTIELTPLCNGQF